MSDFQKAMVRFFATKYHSTCLERNPFTLKEFQSDESLRDITRFLVQEAGSYPVWRNYRCLRVDLCETDDQNFAALHFVKNLAERAGEILTKGLFFSIPDKEWRDYDGNSVVSGKTILYH
ncbi:hypothetical protein J4429_04065 [Candidatus Pacearchaeota archaeon]|nr:hypothetical protein [Candidatus Pacearchaeota archaeon]